MLLEQVRGHLLEHLVVLVEDAARGVDHADVVVAVAVGGGARPALQAHEQDVHVGVPAGRVAAGGQRAQEVVPARGHALGHDRRQRPDDGVGVGRAQVVAEGGRRRVGGVEESPLGDDDLDRRHHAVVVRDVGVDHLQEGQDRRRGARGVGAVDEAGGLRIRAGVVEADAIARHGDGDADRVARARRLAVVVDRGLAAVGAGGDGADLRLHHPAGRGEERLLLGREAREADLLDQRRQAPLADGAAADLGAHVGLDDGQADVGEDEVPHVPAQDAALDHLDRRDAQRLLPDLGGGRVVAAAHGAADVGHVPLGGGPADQRPGHEDGLEGGHVVVLVAQGEDVVVEEDVPRVDLAAEALGDVLAHRRQREGQDGQVLGLLEHAPAGVVQAGDEVARLAQDRRARGLLHADRHLVGDRLERAAQDGDVDRVDRSVVRRAAHGCRSRITEPWRSMRAP